MPTLSSLATPEVVVMSTSGVASDDKDGIITTLVSNCVIVERLVLTICLAATGNKVNIITLYF